MNDTNRIVIIARTEKALGVNVQSILSDERLSDAAKRQTVFETVLTAALSRVKRGDPSKEFALAPDFDIAKYVAAQSASVASSGCSAVPNLYFLQSDAAELKTLTGGELSKKVQAIYEMAGQMLSIGDDENGLAELLIGIGGLAIGVSGAVAAIAGLVLTIASGGSLAVVTVPVAVAGLIATGIGLVMSFATIVFTLLSMPNRDFDGILINDTNSDISIPSWDSDIGESNKSAGIYMQHGSITGLMADQDENNHNALRRGRMPKRQMQDNVIGCSVGLYTFQKTRSTYGTEGILRLSCGGKTIDLFSACPMSNDNRNMMSDAYAKDKIGDADVDLYKAWEKQQKNGSVTVESGSYTMLCTVNDVKNSPAYGVASITEAK